MNCIIGFIITIYIVNSNLCYFSITIVEYETQSSLFLAIVLFLFNCRLGNINRRHMVCSVQYSHKETAYEMRIIRLLYIFGCRYTDLGEYI